MNTEKQYIEAFNYGYILQQYELGLLNTISQNILSENNYLRGFFAGKNQFELENNKRNLFELEQLRTQSHTTNKDREIE